MSQDKDASACLDLIQTLEARRHQADTFAWSVPGLAIAAQAFLLSIALDPSTEPAGRLAAAAAGIVALLLGAFHLLYKQTHYFDLYEAVIERERRKLGLHSVQLDALLPGPFPANTQFVKTGWQKKRLLRWTVRRKARNVWAIVLGSLTFLDVALVGYSAWALVGDPGWL